MNKFEGKKIALGYEIREGPWGGGNQFLRSFKSYFGEKGAQVVHKLEDGLDVIILINTRSGTFSMDELKRYKRRNPKVKIIHRINETDKAKNTRVIDKMRIEATKISDAVIFISEWLRQYYIGMGLKLSIPETVIWNGPDENIFNPTGYSRWEPGTPMKIVTHHWSDNIMKGIDIYKYFDEILADPWMKKRFEFTYIGRTPQTMAFQNTRLVSPLFGNQLAEEIKKNHVYLTAARWEACGMHQLEAACCGLPVLYINEGGGVVETCRRFGIEYHKETFVVGLMKMLEEYEIYRKVMKNFPLNSAAANKKYEEFIGELL